MQSGSLAHGSNPCLVTYRELHGEALVLIVTEGWIGLAATLQTVYTLVPISDVGSISYRTCRMPSGASFMPQ